MVNRWLVGFVRWLTPPEDRAWVDALAAELPSVTGPKERLSWLGGLLQVCAVAAWRQTFRDAWLFPFVIAAGAGLAYFDIESSSRIPYAVLLASLVGLIAFARPHWSWRWSLLISLCLPVAVGLGFEGPYHHDRFDAFYPLLPSVAIAFAASWLRVRFDTIRSRLRPD